MKYSIGLRTSDEIRKRAIAPHRSTIHTTSRGRSSRRTRTSATEAPIEWFGDTSARLQRCSPSRASGQRLSASPRHCCAGASESRRRGEFPAVRLLRRCSCRAHPQGDRASVGDGSTWEDHVKIIGADARLTEKRGAKILIVGPPASARPRSCARSASNDAIYRYRGWRSRRSRRAGPHCSR